MRITLGGNTADTWRIGGDIVIEHRKENDEGQASKSFSQTIRFFDEDFDYLRAKFIDNPEGKFESVLIDIYDDCCEDEKLVFEGIIYGESIGWCEGDCHIDVTAVEYDNDAKALDCVKSTLIDDNHNGFKQQQHPRMVYCLEYRPSVLQDIVMILGIIVNLQFIVFSPIILPVIAIIQAVNLIVNFLASLVPGLSPIQQITNPAAEIAQLSNLIQQVNSFIVGCGRRHPSPLVRNYIKNVCDKCGLQFQSSILNNPSSDYYNTVYYNAPIEKGKRPISGVNGTITTYIEENAPIDTLETYLNKLQLVFNAEWRVDNGILKFERKDFFWQGESWVDYEELKNDNRIDSLLCFDWRAEDSAAFARLKYSEDAVDWVGNEAMLRFSEIAEWNQPFNPAQRGERLFQFPFGTPRFRDDGIDRDVIADYTFWPPYATIANAYEGVLIQNNGTSFQPKLLIWDGQSINFGRTRKYDIPNFGIPASRNYNYPYMATTFGTAPNTAYPTDAPNLGIYGRFLSIENPKVLNDQGKSFRFAFRFDCAELDSFDLNRTVQLPQGQGRITSVTINYSKRIAQVNGNI